MPRHTRRKCGPHSTTGASGHDARSEPRRAACRWPAAVDGRSRAQVPDQILVGTIACPDPRPVLPDQRLPNVVLTTNAVTTLYTLRMAVSRSLARLVWAVCTPRGIREVPAHSSSGSSIGRATRQSEIPGVCRKEPRRWTHGNSPVGHYNVERQTKGAI